MLIKKRSLPLFVLLNCLTLGIYGAIVGSQINKEVNALCKNDGEQPALSYIATLMIRAIPTFFGIIVGLIVGLVLPSTISPYLGFGLSLYGYSSDSVKVTMIFSTILIFSIIFTLIGKVASSLYYKYWWFKQTSRLQLNADRYNMIVREKGSDHFVFRTAINITLLPATIILGILSFLVPALLCFLIGLASSVFSIILITIFVLIFLIFGAEISAGATFSMYHVFDTLNRYASVYRNGARPFDPMSYQYYPSVDNTYPTFIPQIMNREFVAPSVPIIDDTPLPEIDPVTIDKVSTGLIVGVKGTCAGYRFDLIPNEEIIIGKDAKVASVVIDPSYKEISRKHISVIYDSVRDIYRVTDYSFNGTWADGQKLVRGEISNLRRGTVLKLANDKNVFRLG